MTREKARDAVILAITADIKLALIDKIYDDFESRVCENCEYYSRIGSCENKESYCFDQLVYDDFGCNRFERR